MKKLIVILSCVFAVILIICAVFAFKLTIIGEVKNVHGLLASELTIQKDMVKIDLINIASADYLKGYTYEIKNDVMYIEVKAYPIGGITRWDGKIEITGDFSNLKEIYLIDTINKELIWEIDKDV